MRYFKRGFLFLIGVFALLFAANSLTAAEQQNVTVRGKVFFSDNEPIAGAYVKVKGASRGTSTNEQGVFVLENIPSNNLILEVSFIGMKLQEVVAVPGRELVVVMEEEASVLEEIVITTGYGAFRRPEYMGAASVLSTNAVKDIPMVSVSQMLEGAVPGLSITSSSGQPGSTQSYRIRGIGSLNASNEPLYVIDGVPVMSGNMSNDSNSAGGLGIISTLNPADIESITVLKDAASTSLYGARGSNGIILIQTKKGKEGKITIGFRASLGTSDLAYTFREMMGGEERRDLIYEGYINNRINNGYSMADAQAYADARIDVNAGRPAAGYSDWIGAMFHTGVQQDYVVTASGGSQTGNFSSSLGYTKSEGISLSSGLERYTGRLNYSAKYNKIDLAFNTIFSITENKMTPEGSYYASAMYSSRNGLTPSIPIYKDDGSYNTGYGTNGGYNPLNEDANSHYYTRTSRTMASATAGYTIMEGLRLQSMFSIDLNYTKEFRLWGPASLDGREGNGQGRMGIYERFRHSSQTMLSYNKSFGKHSIDAAAVYEMFNNTYEGLIGSAKGYGQDLNYTLTNASTPISVSQPKTREALISYVARANYNYDRKYFLGFTFRRDGSSRLAPGHRWDNFWSVSGSWRVIEESFMDSIKDVVTDLKLRSSYGVTGNFPSGNYDFYGTYSTSGAYAGLAAIYENVIPNPKLKWERGYHGDIGLEIGLFKKISILIDFYQRDTKDLLMSRPLYNVSGFSSMTANVGHFRNRGFEIEMRSVNISKKDLSWETSLNLYHNKHTIVKLSDLPGYVDGRYFRQEGEAFNTYYLREYAGVNPNNGKAQYYMNTGADPRALTEDPNNAVPVMLQDADPKLSGNILNKFSYKFLDLQFNLSFALGGYSYDNGMFALLDDGYSAINNKSILLRGRWKQPGDITNIPQYVSGNATGGWFNSSRGIHSRDHIRLKSITLGANLPSKWISPAGLSRARVYVAGMNVLTFAAYNQYDPEIAGTVAWGVPPLKTWTFGVELFF